MPGLGRPDQPSICREPAKEFGPADATHEERVGAEVRYNADLPGIAPLESDLRKPATVRPAAATAVGLQGLTQKKDLQTVEQKRPDVREARRV